jgi:LPS-assembly lipoprotein
LLSPIRSSISWLDRIQKMSDTGRQMSEKKGGRKRLSTVCLLAALACLPACGFHPVYGARDDNGTPVAEQLNQVAIDNIPDRRGQLLRNELIDRMYGKGRPQQPLYRLSVKLRMTEADLGIQANATSTRTLLDMYGDYVMQDAAGKELFKGTAHSVTSFNTLNDQYGNLTAEEGAIERTISEVGEQIVNRVSLYFAEKPSVSVPASSAPPPSATSASSPKP